MPPVPGVPALEPVNKPMMSPGEAAIPGQTMERTGQQWGQVADAGMALVNHIREAQKSVDKIAARNQLNAAVLKYKDDLVKTANSRDVPDLETSAKDSITQIVKQWAKSPALIDIELEAQSLNPHVEHFAQVRGIDLMGKEWDAQTDVQLQTLLPQLVSARRSGDAAQEKYITDYINHIYDDAVQKGLKSTADKQLAITKIQEGVKKELNEAAILSSDPKERKRAIEQLKNGGSGPLDLSGKSAGDISAMRVHAQEVDHRLTNLSEAQNLNGALNTIANVFQAPEYKDNFEAQEKALQDGEFLKKNGIVSEDGSPNRVLAGKLSAEVQRERAIRHQEQVDQDEKIVEKYSPLIDENKLSRAQIDQIPGLSNRARSALHRQWNENNRFNRQMALQGRQVATREKAEKSEQTTAQVMLEIAGGKEYSPMDIRTMPNVSPKDKMQLLGALEEAKKSPLYRETMKAINKEDIWTNDAEGITKHTAVVLAMYQWFKENPKATAIEAGAQLKAVMSDEKLELYGRQLDDLYEQKTGIKPDKSWFRKTFLDPALNPSRQPDNVLTVEPVAPTTKTMIGNNIKGLVEPGNLDITNRPVVQNDDGTRSTEYSYSFEDEKGREVLVPTVVNGKFLTADGKKPKEGSAKEKAMFKRAEEHYEKTGEHLGIFSNSKDADAYAEKLHNRGGKPAAIRPPGATGTAKGKDGKLHWADSSGKDYGVAE